MSTAKGGVAPRGSDRLIFRRSALGDPADSGPNYGIRSRSYADRIRHSIGPNPLQSIWLYRACVIVGYRIYSFQASGNWRPERNCIDIQYIED